MVGGWFLKSVEKILVWLKSDKNDGPYIYIYIYIYIYEDLRTCMATFVADVPAGTLDTDR